MRKEYQYTLQVIRVKSVADYLQLSAEMTCIKLIDFCCCNDARLLRVSIEKYQILKRTDNTRFTRTIKKTRSQSADVHAQFLHRARPASESAPPCACALPPSTNRPLSLQPVAFLAMKAAAPLQKLLRLPTEQQEFLLKCLILGLVYILGMRADVM